MLMDVCFYLQVQRNLCSHSRAERCLLLCQREEDLSQPSRARQEGGIE